MTGDGEAQTTVVLAVWDGYVAGLASVALPSLRAQEVQAPIVVVDNASAVELPELEGG